MSDNTDQAKKVDADLEMLERDFNHAASENIEEEVSTAGSKTVKEKAPRKFNFMSAIMLVLLLILLATGSAITFLDDKTINKYIDITEVTKQLNGISDKIASLSDTPGKPQVDYQPKQAVKLTITNPELLLQPKPTSLSQDPKTFTKNVITDYPESVLLKDLENSAEELSALIAKTNQALIDNESKLSMQILEIRKFSSAQINDINQVIYTQGLAIERLIVQVAELNAKKPVITSIALPDKNINENTNSLKALSVSVSEVNSKLSNITKITDVATANFTELSKQNAKMELTLSAIKSDILQIKDNNSNKIDNFKEYEMIGFDSNKLYIWIKDANQNVIKVKQGDFLPEYGTVVSVTEEGQIITQLGLVKIKTTVK